MFGVCVLGGGVRRRVLAISELEDRGWREGRKRKILVARKKILEKRRERRSPRKDMADKVRRLGAGRTRNKHGEQHKW